MDASDIQSFETADNNEWVHEEWFHGSESRDIKAFFPLSHFGTYDAALDRLAALMFFKRDEENSKKFRIPQDCYMYRVTITGNLKWLKGPDLKTSRLSGLIAAVMDSSVWSDDQKNQLEEKITVACANARTHWKKLKCNDLEALALGPIIPQMLGYDGYIYPNKHEGSGQPSICVFSPAGIIHIQGQAQIVNVKTLAGKALELLERGTYTFFPAEPVKENIKKYL